MSKIESKTVWYYLIIMVATCDAVGTFPRGNANECNRPLACINLNDCEEFKNLTNMTQKAPKATTLKFLKARLCGFDDIHPKICCSKLSNSHPHHDQINNPNSSIPSTIIIKVPSQVEATAYSVNYPQQCKSPFQCIDLSKCSPMVNLARMENPINPVVAKFIKSQSCGSTDGGNPRVCCSLKSPGSLFSNRTLDNSEDLHETTTTIMGISTTVVEITTRAASIKHSTLVPLWEKSKAMNFIMENWFDYTYFDFLRRRRKIYNENK